MPYCGSRSCHHCFPPGAEERAVLDDAIDQIDNIVRYTTFGDDGFAWHEYQDEVWFQALALAYRAGAAAALNEVRDIRQRFE